MPIPDKIFVNAVVHTVDDAVPSATAFALAGGRIAAVGRDDEIRALAGASTEVRDLGGATVMPGLVDVHNHHLMAGEGDLFEMRFSPTATFEDVVETVRERAAGLGPEEWVIGEAFGSTLIEDFSTLEARRRIDAAAGGRPVVLTDDSHHNRFANTTALARAGITAETPDPEGGRIVRDPDSGEPTGLLYESATLAVTAAVDASIARTPERYRQSSARAIEILNSFGITAFQDAAATVDIMGAVRDLDERGDLHAWVVSSMLSSVFLFADTPVGDALIAQREDFRTAHHRPDFVKVALDGVPPTYTGAFLEPYLEDEEHGACHCGTTAMPPEELTDWLIHTASQGIGAKIHCTGDASVRVALDAIQAVREAGHSDVLFQIAHGQYVHPDDRPRFAALDVAADISPFLWFPGVIPDAIAAVRPSPGALQMQPNRDLADLGVLIAGGIVGAVNATVVTIFGLNSLITTLGRLTAVRGATQLLSPTPKNNFGDAFGFLGIGTIASLPISVWIAALVIIGASIFLALTPTGRHVYAIGVNREAAYLSGVSVKRIPFALFILSGAAAGFAGTIVVSRLNSAPAGQIGGGFELVVLTAVLLGGVALTGGEGSMFGVLVGVLFYGVLNNGLVLLGVTTFWQAVASGVALIVAIGLSRVSHLLRVRLAAAKAERRAAAG